MYSPNTNSNYSFLTNLEKVIINDDKMMRLLVHPPAGWDEENQKSIPDPLEDLDSLIICDSEGKYLDSKEYWDMVEDKFRKGSKRMQIEHVKSAVLYMHEGRERSIFGNAYMNTKEVVFKIVVNEVFEKDSRISRISDRLSYLLTHEIEIAGFGKLRLIGKNHRESPLGNRLQEDIYLYNVLSKSKG